MHNLWYPGLSVAPSAKNGQTSKSKPPTFPRLSEQQILRDRVNSNSKSKVGRGDNDSVQKGFSRPQTRERIHPTVASRPAWKKEDTEPSKRNVLPRVVSCGVRRECADDSITQSASDTRARSSVHRPPPIVLKSSTAAPDSKLRSDSQKRITGNDKKNSSSLKQQRKESTDGAVKTDSGISLLPSGTLVSPQCSDLSLASGAGLQSAVTQLLSCNECAGLSEPQDALLSGWLPHEPALQREVIYVPQPASRPQTTKRTVRTSKHRKPSSSFAFKHLPSVESYAVDYLEHHSFTYTTVSALRPPPMLGSVRYSVQSEHSSVSTEGESVVTPLPPKAKGKNWLNLVKRTSQSNASIESDFVLAPSSSEQQDPSISSSEGRNSRPSTCDNSHTGYKRAPLEDIMEEKREAVPTSSSISVGKYLIIKSKEEQLSLSKDAKDEEEDDEGFGSASTGSIVNHTSSFVQVCESGPSLSSDSHSTIVAKALVDKERQRVSDVYKFPCFKPVLASDNRPSRATEQVMNKARSLGLISPFALREKFIQDILRESEVKKQVRTASCSVRREQMSKPCESKPETKVSRRQSAVVKQDKKLSSTEDRNTLRQRRLSAAMKVYGCKEKTVGKGRESCAGKSHTTPLAKCPPSNTSTICAKVLLLQRRAKANGRARELSASCGTKANRLETTLRIEPSSNFPPIR